MGEPVRRVILDIDNTCADYTSGFYEWLSCSPYRDMVTMPKREPFGGYPYPNPQVLELREDTWREIKDAYRCNGGVVLLPPVPGMPEYIRKAKAQGSYIHVVSTRPGKAHMQLLGYTEQWFSNNRIPFDSIDFTERKAELIRDRWPVEEVQVVFDDDPRVLLELAAHGYPCAWLTEKSQAVPGRVIFVNPSAGGVTLVEGNGEALVTEAMWSRQRAFQKSQDPKYPADLKLKHLVYCTHLQQEIAEVLDCIPWKFNRKTPPAPRTNLVEELVDVCKLWMNVLLLHGVTPAELHQAFDEKSRIVEERARQEDMTDA